MFLWFKCSSYCFVGINLKTWNENLSNPFVPHVMFCRQHSWDWNPKKRIQPRTARAVFAPCGNRGQQLPCAEQYKYNDHSGLQVWLRWDHLILQRGSNFSTRWTEHRGSHCNSTMHCHPTRSVFKLIASLISLPTYLYSYSLLCQSPTSIYHVSPFLFNEMSYLDLR